MAWTASNPVALGYATKKTQYDALWDNADYLYDWLDGRTLFTYQDTAPDGWQITSGCTDALLAVKGGSNAYNVAGGTKLAGTWTQPNHVHSGYSHLHSTGDHSLTDDEMPSHTHSITTFVANTAGTAAASSTSEDKGAVGSTSSAGSGTAHNHGNTGNGGTADTAGSNTAATWRPLANVGIMIDHTGSETDWTDANPVTIGAPTKKDHYDALWDNLDTIYDFLAGIVPFIFENTAPTGWSIVSGVTDGLLAVKGGANAYNVAGGTALQGTWTQPNHTHTGAAHTHSGADHTLTEAQMGVHTHTISPNGIINAAGSYANLGGLLLLAEITATGAAGGGGAHSHQASSGGAVATGNGATANTWRPVANVGILVEKT